MRKITAVMDDKGRTEVEILPDPKTGRFFTKRDFDNLVRSMKRAYRISIKEHRKKIRSTKIVKEQKDGIEIKNPSGEIEDGTETRTEVRAEKPGTNSVRTKREAFAGAAKQALQRSAKLRFGEGS